MHKQEKFTLELSEIQKRPPLWIERGKSGKNYWVLTSTPTLLVVVEPVVGGEAVMIITEGDRFTEISGWVV